jgi:hypothetical protein
VYGRLPGALKFKGLDFRTDEFVTGLVFRLGGAAYLTIRKIKSFYPERTGVTARASRPRLQ